MGRAIDLAEYRLAMNFHRTNDCPYEAKNLKGSNKVCPKSYKALEEARMETISRGDLFTYTAGQGFLRCKSCLMVKGLPDHALEAPLSHMTNYKS